MAKISYPVSPDPYSQGWAGAQQVSARGQNSEDPSLPCNAYYLMLPRWKVMRAVLEGNYYLKQVQRDYVPALPNESDECYSRRLLQSLFTPYVSRVTDAAIGLILRKPITLEGGNEEFWESWTQNVDRQGTDLQEFARKVLRSSIGYGHCSILVDYPKADGIRTLADERAAQLAPYMNTVEPWDILGWRHDVRQQGGQLQQVRLREIAVEPDGRFGEKIVEQIRVLEPGKYELFRKDEAGEWQSVEQGRTSLSEIPLATTYSEKQATLVSEPPLLDCAYINLAHYRLQSQHLNALTVAGFPLLVLKGYDDQGQKLQLDVSKAIAMPVEGGVEYVEPANQAFQAYMDELDALANQCSNLGIAVLAQQKMVAEAAKKAQLDRADTNSMLANISLDLEQTLQAAVDMAAAYAGQEAPVVGLSRDFDAQTLDGQGITAINTMFTSGLIDQETALQLLHQGEILKDDVDIEEILSRSEADELKDIEMQVERTSALSEVGEGTQPNDEE
jgi:hypothetical protein